MTQKNTSKPSAHSELNRYNAQVRLPEIGSDGQLKLLSSNVLIVGCGALGSIAAAYLAGAGVGTIGIADFDTIDSSNLQRQILYTDANAGLKKVQSLADSLRALNPTIRILPFDTFVREQFLAENIHRFDFVIDAADNPSTTYLIDRFCSRKGIGYVTAGISGWQAQILTCNGSSPNFETLFPSPESSSEILPCSIAGVFGPLAGIVGSIQASEAVKYLLGIPFALSGSLMTVDLLDNRFEIFPVADLP